MNIDNEDFNWDDTKVPENFFDDSPEDLARLEEDDKGDDQSDIDGDDSVDTDTEDNQEQRPTKKASKIKPKTDEELADELFNDEEESDSQTEEDETSETQSEGVAKQTLNFLRDKGIFDLDEEEDIEDLSDEEIQDLVEDKWSESLDARISDLLEGMPSEVKNLIRFAKDGGDVGTFFKAMANGSKGGLTPNMDMSEEHNQEAVMRAMLAEEDYDDEDIEAQIELLKDSGRLESMSKKKFDIWKKKNKEQNDAIVAAQAQREKQEKELSRKARVELTNKLANTDSIGDFKLSRQDKRELPSYFQDKSVKLQSGASISEFHKDIYEAMANENTALQLAKLLRNRKEDGTFNLSSIERQAQTKVSKDVKNNIRRNKDVTPTRSAGRSSYNSIADLL